MQKSNFYLLLLPLLLFLASCSNQFYSTASPNIFLPKEKNCHQITASYGTDGVALSGGTALTNHFMMTLNARYSRRAKYYYYDFDPTGYLADNNTAEAELGMGYFSSFGINKQGRFSIQGGVNLGVTDDITPIISNYYDITGPYFNVFVQPSFGFVRKRFEFGVSSKLSLGAMSNSELEPYFYEGNKSTLSLVTFESALRISYGFEKWKLFLQYSSISGNPNYRALSSIQNLGYESLIDTNLSIGIKKTFGAP